MSNNIPSSSLPGGAHSQLYGDPQEPGAPPDSGTAKDRKPRNSRNQRRSQRAKQPSSVKNKHENPINSNPLSIEQDAFHSATENDSQDSAAQHHSLTQHKRRGKHGTPNRQQDYTTTAIPGFDGTASPGQARSLSRATGSQAAQATPIKQAYAGPTFHASPAASSLPMPKFLSKSMPPADPHHDTIDDDISSRNSPARNGDWSNSTNRSHQLPPPPPREESPLDVLFNAHRAEKARQSSEVGFPSIGPMSQRQLNPKSNERLPHESNSRPGSSSYSYSSAARRSNQGAFTEKAMFMMELDGTGDSETSEDGRPGPVPFKDRLGATRSTSSLSVTQTNDNGNEEDELERQAKSQALKNLLMSQQVSHSYATQPRSAGFQPSTVTEGNAQRHELPASPSCPRETLHDGTTSTTASAHSATDVQAMEENLRRILKLNP